jgi:tetratricopeptide (TPR) repeat protein
VFLCPVHGQPDQNTIAPIVSALRSHDFAAALSLSQAALAKQPADYRVWTLRGMATAGTGNLPLALTAYQHALRLAPTYLPALEGAAQIEFQLGHESAMPLLQKILAQRPDDQTAHALAGMLEYRKRNCPDAIDHFRNAPAVIAAQPGALTEYGMCLANLQRNEDAVPIFAQVLALEPAKDEVRYNLALAQWNAHQGDDALKTLQPLVEKVPVDADALALSADILESKDDTAHAVELLRKALLANPRDVDAYMQFATLSYDHASPRVGIDILNSGLTQLPNEPKLYLVRGILLTQIGEFTRAADDFEVASRIDPKLQFLGVAQGLVQSQEHNSAQALAKFRAAVKAHPNEAYAQYLLAEALSQQGAPEGSPMYKEELDAATKAAQLDPSLVEARDLLSLLYFGSGHLDLAIEQSRAALARNPNDEQAVYHLILELRKTSQKDEINTLVKRLVELRANSKVNRPPGKHYLLYEGSSPAGPAASSSP